MPALKVLLFTLVRSKLGYASVIWNPLYDVHEKAVGTVQKTPMVQQF